MDILNLGHAYDLKFGVAGFLNCLFLCSLNAHTCQQIADMLLSAIILTGIARLQLCESWFLPQVQMRLDKPLRILRESGSAWKDCMSV